MDAAFAAYYAWLRMQAGDCDTAHRRRLRQDLGGRARPRPNLQLDPYYQAAIGLDPTSTAALQASAYMARSGASDRDLAAIAARNRAAGARNPDTQVRDAASRRRAGEDAVGGANRCARATCRRSARARRCLILAAEGKAEKLCDRPVWIHGVDHRTEMQTLGGRDLSRSAGARLAAEKAFAMAGLKTRRATPTWSNCSPRRRPRR